MAYNVLIADDSASIRYIIEKALRHADIPLGEVFMAADGREALDLIGKEWIDLVLADLNMPNMGGIELIERMQHQGVTGTVPVVIVSTESRQQVIEWLLSSGAAAFLRKPFAPEELGAIVHSVLAPQVESSLASNTATAFYEALEGFAMLIAEKTDEPAALPAQVLRAKVVFVGPGVEGEVVLVADPEMCAAIARSATGADEADGHDALAELANTTVGQLVGSIEGGPFALHPPVRDACDADTCLADASSMASWSTFDVEGRIVAVGVNAAKRW